MIERIRKRDGRTVPFNQEKVYIAIEKAARSVGRFDEKTVYMLTIKAVEYLESHVQEKEILTVEQVQDAVEKILIENGKSSIAKAYILYRQKRAEIRGTKKMLGVIDELKLPLNAILVLEKRYLCRDENGKIIESTSQMYKRVARSIAEVELIYLTGNNRYKGDGSLTSETETIIQGTADVFYDLMVSGRFTPNSPTLMNAGTSFRQLSACFVLPIEDSLKSIFETIRDTALIHQTGGGTGFSFSHLRPKGDIVKTTGGIASGPISFATVFDKATDVIKQGGRRRGANMGMLRVDHPDVMDFIVCKEKEGVLANFNLSVALTDKFMRAVEKDADFDLVNPRTGAMMKRLSARAIWNLLIMMAWKNGEPGVVFIDSINKANPTPELGTIESTNPCGEQPLLPYESCNLGSINLSKFVNEEKDGPIHLRIDWDKLEETIYFAVRFLDDVINANVYPIPQIDGTTKQTRKIGLGVMGFADMLILLGIPYDSNDALRTAEAIMKFITEKAREASMKLAEERGCFPAFKESRLQEFGTMRNATVTTIAPTGTIAIINGCSQGIEPLFAVAYIRDVSESLGHTLLEINPLFENIALREGFYSEELMGKIAHVTSIQAIKEIPESVRAIFRTAHDVSAEWHVRMQAAFQKYTDNAVSKTINFPETATPSDVEKAYLLAYKLGCKGITVYRFGSRKKQILSTQKDDGYELTI